MPTLSEWNPSSIANEIKDDKGVAVMLCLSLMGNKTYGIM